MVPGVKGGFRHSGGGRFVQQKKYNDSWVNLKGGGKLVTKEGNGEQMRGMVPGLGSVHGYPPRMSLCILNRNFT